MPSPLEITATAALVYCRAHLRALHHLEHVGARASAARCFLYGAIELLELTLDDAGLATAELQARASATRDRDEPFLGRFTTARLDGIASAVRALRSDTFWIPLPYVTGRELKHALAAAELTCRMRSFLSTPPKPRDEEAERELAEVARQFVRPSVGD